MEDIRIKLSALWVARMLVGFLGDVLRFLEPGMLARIMNGEDGTMRVTHELLLVSAAIMVVPILMVYLSLTLRYRVNRWANIVAATFFICFDLIGLPTYTSAYSTLLIIVGVGFCGLIIWHAWRWPEPAQTN